MRKVVGATMIEMMIAIVIIALLLALGAPSYTTYMHNATLRSSAEIFAAGLQAARTEAVRRNVSIQFVLTDDEPTAANVATVTASATGQNWMIRTADQATFIEGRVGAEGTGRTGTPPVQIDGGATSSITFVGLGTTTLASAATFQFTNPAGGDCAVAGGGGGPMRCLNVVVSVGGQVRLCDPIITSSSDTRGC